MTTSASSDFESNRDEIIQDALANVGAVAPNGTPTGSQLAHASRALNRLVKSMDPDGEFTWRLPRRTFTTTSGTAAYTRVAGNFLSDVISIDQPMTYVVSGETSRQPIQPISRDEYVLLDRGTSGRPQFYFLERTLTTFSVTLWPKPDATGDTIEYTAVVRSQDFDTGANTPDFPPEWTNCLVYGLSGLIAPTYKQPQLGNMYMQQFESEKARLIQRDTEVGNVVFVPWGGS